jgi:hypothetical protein
MNRRTVLNFLGATMFIIAAPSAPARAETINFKANLSAVAPNDKGSGTLLASYDTATKRLSYVVNYAGLTGPATAAHFLGSSGISVQAQGNVANPIRGTATLTDAQAADLLAGKWQFSIRNQGGEIRGQVTK